MRPALSARGETSPDDILRTVREEFLPIDRNFFRREATLRQSLDRLDRAWTAVRDHITGDGCDAVRAREAAALTVTSRWAYTSALARAESRGMQRRVDCPAPDPALVCSFEVAGLDRIAVTRREIFNAAAA